MTIAVDWDVNPQLKQTNKYLFSWECDGVVVEHQTPNKEVLGWKCDEADDCGDNSDETPNLCGKRKCDADKFLCDNGRCIPNDWKCDFDDDCGDGSDEKEEWGCRNKTCKQGWWKCRSNYRCIPDYLRCNGKDDCRDDSDELEENCPTCHPTGDYQCANKRCIPKRWLCDFENDCGDSSDEDPSMCAPLYRNCSETEWRCKNQKCIRKKWICDHENDCLDNSDEDPQLCKANATQCSGKEFTCDSAQCIDKKYRCNGLQDCYNLTDERGCQSEFTCPEDMFQCNNKACIKRDSLCDGWNDCSDQSDETTEICEEINCDGENQFRCNNRKCIQKWRTCDGLDHCGDGSDENNVTCPKVPATDCGDLDLFKCKNGRCVSPYLICNNIDDCGDATDEMDCSKTHGYTNCSVDNGGCEQICTDLSEGSFYCSCRHGFRSSSSFQKACDDEDECSHWGNFCPQLCNNVKGSFKCQCADGFKDDKGQGTECKSEDVDKVLFFATVHEIRRFVPRKKQYMGVVARGNRITGLDVNVRRKLLYWTDELERDIFRSSIPESQGRLGIPDKLGIRGSSPHGIAVDWVEGNIYWTDIQQKLISVALGDGRYTKILINGDIEEPLAIAVNPKRGLLYWADANYKSPKIEMSWMNGEHRKVLVSTRLRRPTALTVDNLMYDRIYWTDSKENLIESMQWDGSDRVAVKGVYSPVSIDVFENKMFWVSRMNGTGYYINKFGKGNDSVIQTGLLFPTAVRMFHYRRVDLNVKSRCPKKGSTCSHLCLLVPGGFQCACPDNSTFIEGSQNICDAAIIEAKPVISPCNCWNGGSCVTSQNGSAVCLCPKGYSGVSCEHVEPVKIEHSLPGSHLVTIVVPTVIVSVVTIGVLLVIIFILRRKKTVKSSSGAAVISYGPRGKVEIMTEGQGHIETPEQVPGSISDISGSTQFSNPIYETLKGDDPNRLNLNVVEETSFYTSGSKALIDEDV